MLDKTLVGYAILNYYSNDGKSILDAYIPLVNSCLIEKNVETVSREDIKSMLSEKYGIDNITHGAADSIIQIMVSKQILNKDRGQYWVNKENITQKEINQQDSLLSRFSIIISQIKEYAHDSFSIDFTNEEIEANFIKFLQSHDMEIAMKEDSIYSTLNKKKNDKTCKYIISRYILDMQESNPKIIDDIVAFAQGHSLASVVTLDNFTNYGGKLDEVTIALDSPIIFNLLGLNGPSNKSLTDELISILKDLHASFAIFRKNYDEVLNTLTDAEWRLRTHKYVYEKSSRVLKFACREHKNAAYIRMKIQQVEQLLSDNCIEIIDAPDLPKSYNEIDIDLLTDLIKGRYTHNGEIELKEYQEDLINTDVDTISYIYRMRGNSPATNLKKCKALLLTTNKAIAFASRHNKLSEIRHNIPVCLTDVFLSTILWANYPSKNKELNEKLLMSECYANIVLDDAILKAFYEDVKKYNAENRITDEQVLLVMSSNLTISLLEQKTYNDFERYSDSTPEEIVREIEANNKREINALTQKLDKHDKRYMQIAKVTANIIYFACIVIIASLFILIKFIDLTKLGGARSIFGYIVIILATLWGLLNHCGIIPKKFDIIDRLTNWLYKMISNFFEKE